MPAHHSPQQPLAEYITAHNKTHLIFDFDATLVLMSIPWKKWGEELRDELRTMDAELWQRYEYRGVGTAQNDWVARHGDKALDILMHYEPLFEMPYHRQFVHNPALLKQVEAFKQTYHLLVWSSNSRQLVEAVLEQLGMADWFEKIVARDSVRYVKPSAEGFSLLRDPAVPKNRYVLIGDSSHDRAAAEAAGIDFYHEDFFQLGR